MPLSTPMMSLDAVFSGSFMTNKFPEIVIEDANNLPGPPFEPSNAMSPIPDILWAISNLFSSIWTLLLFLPKSMKSEPQPLKFDFLMVILFVRLNPINVSLVNCGPTTSIVEISIPERTTSEDLTIIIGAHSAPNEAPLVVLTLFKNLSPSTTMLLESKTQKPHDLPAL